jgi:K+-transporting ATPase KdpF subunit
MSGFELTAVLLVAGLIGYLVWALLFPEELS